MSATETAIPAAGPPPEVVRVHVPPRSFRSELRAMKIVWKRDLIRFRSDRTPESCTYAQLEEVAPAELAALFGEVASQP